MNEHQNERVNNMKYEISFFTWNISADNIISLVLGIFITYVTGLLMLVSFNKLFGLFEINLINPIYILVVTGLLSNILKRVD